jgi:hypothetical protein
MRMHVFYPLAGIKPVRQRYLSQTSSFGGGCRPALRVGLFYGTKVWERGTCARKSARF